MLKEFESIRVFYFASTEDGKPRVRPFGLKFELDGKLYFGMGKHKAAWKQVAENPNVEICAMVSDDAWLRIKGVAVADDSEQALEKAFEVSPHLRSMYNEETGLTLGLVYLTEIDAEIGSLKGEFRKVSML